MDNLQDAPLQTHELLSQQGVVYLIHLDSPMEKKGSPAQHYVGFALRLEQRLNHHRAGSGSRFLAAANHRGIPYSVAADWLGDRYLERAIKNRKQTSVFCPICAAKVGKVAVDPLVSCRKARIKVMERQAKIRNLKPERDSE